MRVLLWVIFAVLTVYMGSEGIVVKKLTSCRYTIIQAEFADSTAGKAMFKSLNQVNYGRGTTLLDLVRSNTHTDFLFIIDYSLLILLCSYMQMQNEKSLALNSLLRLNLLLAVLVALLDVTENLKILYNIRHFADNGFYSCSCLVSTFKWTLSGWAVLIWLISLIKSLFSGSGKATPQPGTVQTSNLG
jgi:hypothetical protein